MARCGWLTLLSLLFILSGTCSTATPLCDDCTWAVRLLKDAMCDDGINDAAVEWVDDQVCPLLFNDKESLEECQQFAEALIPIGIQWLRQSATPATLCASAGVCDAAPCATRLTQLRERRLGRARVFQSFSCSMCEYLVSTVKVEIDDPVRLEKLKEQALKACASLPPPVDASCTDFVTNYSDLVIKAIDQLDPNATCTSIGLCAPPSLASFRLPPLPKETVQALGALRSTLVSGQAAASNSGTLCSVCKMTVLEANTLVSNPTVQQQMINYTLALCDSLGASASDTCKTYVQVYGPAVFLMLKEYLQPDPVCEGIGFCTNATSTSLQPASALPQTTKRLLPGRTLDRTLAVDPVPARPCGDAAPENAVLRQVASDLLARVAGRVATVKQATEGPAGILGGKSGLSALIEALRAEVAADVRDAVAAAQQKAARKLEA